ETFTEFQFIRLCQLSDLLKNINNVEAKMAEGHTDILFTGDVDNETSIDRDMVKTFKYGANAFVRELKDEGLDREAGFIIFENKK
ncbi:MAG: hypothetical protein AABY22_30920, partial [Nanoarchaeota archaeon]